MHPTTNRTESTHWSKQVFGAFAKKDQAGRNISQFWTGLASGSNRSGSQRLSCSMVAMVVIGTPKAARRVFSTSSSYGSCNCSLARMPRIVLARDLHIHDEASERTGNSRWINAPISGTNRLIQIGRSSHVGDPCRDEPEHTSPWIVRGSFHQRGAFGINSRTRSAILVSNRNSFADIQRPPATAPSPGTSLKVMVISSFADSFSPTMASTSSVYRHGLEGKRASSPGELHVRPRSNRSYSLADRIR